MDFTRRHFCRMAGSAALAGYCSACSVNPATGDRNLLFLSAEEEKRIGAEEHPKILEEFGGVYGDPAVAAYIAGIGSRLVAASEAPHLGFTFTLLNSPIINAFALPGGYVYITRGLVALAENEAEVAGVMGHEIGHVIARHSAQRMSRGLLAQLGALGASILGQAAGIGPIGDIAQLGAGAYLQSFSREQEFEADMLGVRYLAQAGYDTQAMATFLRKMQAYSRLQAKIEGRPPGSIDQFNIMASHPRTVDRVQRAIAAANVSDGRGLEVARTEFLTAIDGMVFGDDPDQGVIRGNRFLHKELRFAFEVPPEFSIINQPNLVAARGPEGRAVIVFDLAPKPFSGSMAAYIAQAWAQGARVNELESMEVNGMPAATGWVRQNARQGPVVLRLVAIRYDPGRIYRFTFVAPAQSMQRFAEAFRRTTYSFRKLSPQEAASIVPRRIDAVRVQPSDTQQSMAARMQVDKYPLDWFQVLNGLDPQTRLEPGKLVKLVV